MPSRKAKKRVLTLSPPKSQKMTWQVATNCRSWHKCGWRSRRERASYSAGEDACRGGIHTYESMAKEDGDEKHVKQNQKRLVEQLTTILTGSPAPSTHWLLARCLALLYWVGDSFTSSLTVDRCNDIIHSKDDSSSFQPSRLGGCRCLYSKDFVFSGLCNDAGQSRLSGAGPGHPLPAAAAHVLTLPRQPGQPGPQPLRECTQHMVSLLNLFLTLKNTLTHRDRDILADKPQPHTLSHI